MSWGLQLLAFTGLGVLGEGAVVDDRVKGRVNQVEDLIVGPGMPVLLRIRNGFEWGDCGD